MESVLLTSGYLPVAIEALSREFHLIQIENPVDGVAYLQRAATLPAAVVIGEPDDPTNPRNDIVMPAQAVLATLHQLDPELPVIISAHLHSPATIVDVIRRGAFDYVVEADTLTPERVDAYVQQFCLAIRRAVQWRLAILENRQLRKSVGPLPTGVDAIQARSSAMVRVLDLVRKVAVTPATILLSGESGTGKEVVARAIHTLSPRGAEPFLAINCGALSETLLSSELFGHVRGSFTGADRDTPGLIRQAGNGTLLLDELGTISPALQVTLLRVLEQRMARPVGGQNEYPVRCRFLAATNTDLSEAVRAGTLREDLYYRLNVFHIHLPPLRDRREDIPILAQHFLTRIASDYGKSVRGFSAEAMSELESQSWPGNIRQLRNVIERAVILCDAPLIEPHHLHLTRSAEVVPRGHTYDARLRTFETQLLRQTLQDCSNNLSEAARRLNMKRTTLAYRVKLLGISAG